MDGISKNFLEHSPQVRTFRVLEYDNVYSTCEHKSGFHELLYILEGRMTLHLGEKLKFHAIPGDFLLIPAGMPHRDEFPLLKGLRILLVHFDWDEPEYFQNITNRALINLSYETRSEAQRRLEFLRGHWNNTEFGLANISLHLHSILMLFYCDIMQLDSDGGTGNIPAPVVETMRRVKHFLDQNFSSPISLKDAAEFAGISSSYLSRQFHHEYGIGFNAYLTARRLESARHLLRNSSLQIGEIAAMCGFSSVSYFIRVFRLHYGVTPKKHLETPKV
ncbi:MAG: AraC family transcriptional regulator [Lentisphaeria bacterium]|nr:AraC family transcriptional regulator [Lentisphaeria bacterium]